MALMDQDGITPQQEGTIPEEEDYSDFSNPINLLRAPSWVKASPASRPKLIDRALNAHLKQLEAKPDKKVPFLNAKGEMDEAPMWSSAKTMTKAGQEYVERSRRLLQTAAQDPEGGIYKDEFSGKWETAAWVEDVVAPQKKGFDPLSDFDRWKEEKAAITTDDLKPAQTWEDFVAFSNAEIGSEEAKIDPDNKELKEQWARRMALSDFDPRTMGDRVIDNVAGQHVINPAFYSEIDKVEGAISELDVPESEKRLLLMDYRKKVEENAGLLVNSFASADAAKQLDTPLEKFMTGGVVGQAFAGAFSRPLNDEFNEAMAQPGASAYDFIKANKERFNKDNYGVGQELLETFRDALVATGGAAIWIGSAGQVTAPMEAWGGVAADSAKAYNNTKVFDVFGIDINRRDLTELGGQLGSFVALGGLSSFGRSAAAKAATKAATVTEASLAVTKTTAQKVAGVAKAIATDPEVVLGSLQAAGMGYGKTFNDVLEQTGSREEAHKQASVEGVSTGLSAFIATSVMNRFSSGAGKLFGSTDDSLGLVQRIKARASSAASMKETKEVLEKLKSMTPDLRKEMVRQLATEMNSASRKLGLRGFGVAGDVAAEGVEEALDEVISDALSAIADDSKSWTDAEWSNIQQNWQGYIKAGILGAIGGGVGGVKSAAFNSRQVFGKSAAIEVQEGIWKRIKANVARFESPELKALEGGREAYRSVAEYLADDGPSVQEKAKVLIASAREKTLDLTALNTAASPAAAAAAPEAAPAAASSAPATSSPVSYEEGSLGDLMAKAGISAPEGVTWNKAEISEGPTRTIKGIGEVNLVNASTDEEGGSPHPVALKVVKPDGSTVYLSAEQAMKDIPNEGFGKSMLAGLENSGQDELFKMLTTKVEAAKEGEGESSTLASQPPGTASVEGPGGPAAAADEESKGSSGAPASGPSSDTLNGFREVVDEEKGQIGFLAKGVNAHFSINKDNKTAVLDTVFRPGRGKPNDTGKGDGAKLLAKAEKSLTDRGITSITAEVDSPGLVKFYEENGYTVKDVGGKLMASKSLSSPAPASKPSPRQDFAARVGKRIKLAGYDGTIGKAPKVTQRSSGSSHIPEMVGFAETGLWIDRDGKVTIERRLLDELEQKHNGSSNAVGDELKARIKALRGSVKLDALSGQTPLTPVEAAGLIDNETSFVVASGLIENSLSDTTGGKWEKVDRRSPQARSQTKENAIQDGSFEQNVYEYSPPQGQVMNISQGQIVQIVGQDDAALVFDSVENGKWVFRKVDLKLDRLRLKTLTGETRNLEYNKNRLNEPAKLAQALLQEIVSNDGSGGLADLKKLFDSVVNTVAPGFKGRFVVADLGGTSFLQTDKDSGTIKVDMKKLRSELHTLYNGVTLTNATANDVLATDMARVLAMWTDEEVLHLLTIQEFDDNEIVDLYTSIASNQDHPFNDLLRQTVEERFPERDPDPDSESGNSLSYEETYIVGAELLRKLHQLKNTGTFSEQAKLDSLRLQFAVNLDTEEERTSGPSKLLRTIGALVARYSNRVRNILWMRWQAGRLPKHQQSMLFRLDAAYKRAGVQGDVNFAQEAAEQQAMAMQRTYADSHMSWGEKISGEHFRAVAAIREMANHFPSLSFGNMFTVDGGTMEMRLNPMIRSYLRQHVSDYADIEKDGKLVEAPIFEDIDKMLSDINDEKPSDEGMIPGNTGLARAKQLIFFNRQVLEAKMAALDFDVTPALELGSSKMADVLHRVGEHIDREVPADQQAESYRQLLSMATDNIRAIEGDIEMAKDAFLAEQLGRIERMSPYTSAGRMNLISEAKAVGLANPFVEGKINSDNFYKVLEKLQADTISRIRALSKHSRGTYLISKNGKTEPVTVLDLTRRLREARAGLRKIQNDYLAIKPDAATAVDQRSVEAGRRVTKFIEFKQALDEYNRSVTNVVSLAFGDIWEAPREFGLNYRNLNNPTVRSGEARFLDAVTTIKPTSNPDKVFGVEFQKTGPYLGYRPKKEYPESSTKPLTEEQRTSNAYREVLDRAANSNAAFVGRMAWVNHYVDYMMGRIGVSEDPDTYQETGGFSLPKTRGENDDVRYRPEHAFRTIDVRKFNGLIFAAQKEANSNAKSLHKKHAALDELVAFVKEMEKWAAETLAYVQPSKDTAKTSNLILRMGGKQTLAGRVKPLIESQFARKTNPKRVNGELPVNGIIALLDDFHALLSANDSVLESELVNGEIVTQLRARLDGANDASKLAGKALIEFGDKEWRKNLEQEASRAQRSASFEADNKELAELEDSPIDVRVVSNLAFQVKFHERIRDYKMGSTFAFEALEAYAAANRGEGVMPYLYREAQWKKVYPKEGSDFRVPAYSKLEKDSDGRQFYWEKIERDNPQGNVTDPNAFGDQRTNRAKTFDDLQDSLFGDRVMSDAELAIDREASPEVSMRIWKTTYAMLIGSQSASDKLDVDAGRQFFFDLYALEQGKKSIIEAKKIIRRGIVGTFPLMKYRPNAEAFYDSMYEALGVDGIIMQELKGDVKDLQSVSANNLSVETVLVKLMELKRDFEASIVENARAEGDIGQALAAVNQSLGQEIEVDEEFTEEVDDPGGTNRYEFNVRVLPEGLPPFPKNTQKGSEWIYTGRGDPPEFYYTDVRVFRDGAWKPFDSLSSAPIQSNEEVIVRTTSHEAEVHSKVDKVKFEKRKPSKRIEKKIRKVKKKALRFNTTSSKEEATAIARLIKGMMLSNGPVSEDGVVSNALNVYDASLLVNGVDGIGNKILSLLASNLPGKTLIVSPSEKQVTRFGLDDVGLKIFRGENGLPNVIYAPQGQKNPEKNESESFGGIAQLLVAAAKDPAIKGIIEEMERKIRETVDPAFVAMSVVHTLTDREQAMISKLPQEEQDSLRADILSHFEDVSELGRILGVDSKSLFMDGTTGLLLAELLTNPQAKRLFDQAYIGTDVFEDTLLSPIHETNLKEGLDAILRVGSDSEAFDEDYIENATEDSVEIEEELVDVNFTRPDVDWLEKMNERLANGEITAEEEEQMLTTLFVGNPPVKKGPGERPRNRFGPDARHINGRLAAMLGGDGLNPSDAFLYNGLARVLELGKASGGYFPQPPVDPERSTRDILVDPDTYENEEKAKVGPMLKGASKASLQQAGSIYVGEMRNLTLPKANGSTSAHIAFDHKRIQTTNASLMLRSPEVRAIASGVAIDRIADRLEADPKATSFGRIDVAVPLTEEIFDSIGRTLPDGYLANELAEVSTTIPTLEAERAALLEEIEAATNHIAFIEADAGEVFVQLENSDWSQSLRDQTRNMIVKHVTEGAWEAAKNVERAANLGIIVHNILSENVKNDPRLAAAVNGIQKQAALMGSLIRERNRLTTPDEETNEYPVGDVKGINSQISDAGRMINLHAKIINFHIEAAAKQVMQWTGIDPKKANYKQFLVKSFNDTDKILSKDLSRVNGEIMARFVAGKFSDAFVDNMVRDISSWMASSSPFAKGGAIPKSQTNAFMRMVAEAYAADPEIDIDAFVEERINEALDDEIGSDLNEEDTIGESFRESLKEIAMTTADYRLLASSRAMTADQVESRKQAEIRLGVAERQLAQVSEQLAQIENSSDTIPIGLGYHSEVFMDRRAVLGARMAITRPVGDSASPAVDSGTMSSRRFWELSTALQRALTNYSTEAIDDAYKFVRGTTEQFLQFDPLKAINQAVALVNVENEVVKGLMQDARADARQADWKGLTSIAAAALTEPSEVMLLTKGAKNNVKQINTPQGWRKRKDLIGQLIENNDESMIVLPLNAKELLMRHWPKTVNKRNVNRVVRNIVLDALPSSPPKNYSYFLASAERQKSDPFNDTGFSASKSGLTKGEAAKAFAKDWMNGMEAWLNDAMNKASGGSKKIKTDGDLYKAQQHQFGHMIEMLVIAHGDPNLSDETRKEIDQLLQLIDSQEFVKIGTSGMGSGKMDVNRMQKLRVETVFSKAFSEIEEEAIRQLITMRFVSFDGSKHAIELGALKYLHHQDARMRAQFRRSYAARQAAINLTAILEYGIDGKSGRIGYTIAEKKIKQDIADAASKTGTGAKNQTIGYLLAVFRGVDQSFAMSKHHAAEALIRDLGRGLHQLFNLNKAQEQYFNTDKTGLKGVLPKFNRYWNAENIDLVRDVELAKWVFDLVKASGMDKAILLEDDDATIIIDKFIGMLEAEVENGKLAEVNAYADVLNKTFADISSSMQLTMAMLSRDAATGLPGSRQPTGQPWQDEARDAYRETYSTVPLRIGFAAQPDPSKRSIKSSKFISDPADIVSFKDASFFGGYGRHEFYYSEKRPFRPISVNGLTAPLSLVDDAVYRLNVTPTYEVLRRSIGRSVTENGVSTIKDGHLLQTAQSMEPTGDPRDPSFRKLRDDYYENIKLFREALSGVATEVETVMQNDAANGVLNTGGAEVMRFLGSGYIVRSLASLMQLWDQSASPSIGYSLGKIVVGKGGQAATYFQIIGRILTDSKFRKQAREWVKQVDPMVYYRAADGQDVVRNAMRSQVRFGANKVKNKAGKGLRKYEEIGEMALDKTIGNTERVLATSIYLTELMGYLNSKGMSIKTPDDLFSLHSDDIAIMDKTNSRRKVSDVMALSDQSRKSWMFQNRTSSPARNALWRSLVRFSNHTSSMASNTSVLIPVLFDSKADEQTALEARENVVTTIAQNILFYPLKAKMLVPLLLYGFFLLGDDDDEAQKKAQKVANKLLFSNEDDNMLQGILKAIFFGKQRELFQQDKDPDAAQASALAEIMTKSQVELLTAIPVFGVAFGYSPISGLAQDIMTDRMSISMATMAHNAVSDKTLKRASSPYDANAVTIRKYDRDWGEAMAALTAPGQMAYDIGAAGVLSARYNMTDYASRDRMTSLLDTAIYLGTEIIPFAREPRSEMKGKLKDVVNKEEKRKNR